MYPCAPARPHLQGAELELAAALGVSLGTLETWSADWAPRTASTGLCDLLVKLPSLADLRALRPNMRALARLSQRLEVLGLHAFCAVRGEEEALQFQGVDYHVRKFAPLVGLDEETATGSSNCALACALRATGALPAGFARRDAACRLYGLGATLVFAQGDAIGEPSRILVQLPSPSDSEGQPWVGGRFGLRGGSVARHASPAAAWRVAEAAVRLMGCVQSTSGLGRVAYEQHSQGALVAYTWSPRSSIACPDSSPSLPAAAPPLPLAAGAPTVPLLPASLWDSGGTAVVMRTSEDAEGRAAPGSLAPGRLQVAVGLLDPLDVALFVGVGALLYRYATARAAGVDEAAVGYIDASLLNF